MKNCAAAPGETQSPTLGASEERYRSLLNSIDVGFCVVEILFDDDGSPVDFRFLETNPAFEKHSRLSDSAAREFAPDAILLDIGLPVVDGLQVARRIRQERELRNVLLIALTGYGQDADRQATRDAGFDYHLAKPVDFKTIESTLANVKRT